MVAVVALVVLGAVIWGVVALAARLGEREPAVGAAPSSSATPTPTPSTAPTPSATPGYQPVACPSDVLEITEAGAASTVAAGSPVSFELVVTNAGPVPCLLEAGAGTLGVVIHSGADRIWSSVDCAEDAPDRRLLLDVGAQAELSATWDQVRSAPGCPQGQQPARRGAYRAAVTTDGGGSAVLGWMRTFTIE